MGQVLSTLDKFFAVGAKSWKTETLTILGNTTCEVLAASLLYSGLQPKIFLTAFE